MLLALPRGLERLPSFATARRSGLTPLLLPRQSGSLLCFLRLGGLGSPRSLLLAGWLPGGAALTALRSGEAAFASSLPGGAAQRSGDSALLCRCPAERPDTTAATPAERLFASLPEVGRPWESADPAAGWLAARRSMPCGLERPPLLRRCPAEQPIGLEILRCFAAARRSGLTTLLLLPGGAASLQPTEPPVAALAQSSPLLLPLPGGAALCFSP